MPGACWIRFNDREHYIAKEAPPELLGRLPAGMYGFSDTMGGLQASRVETLSEPYRPGGASAVLLGEIDSFIGRRDRYESIGMPYKRGILLHGPAGCGKTSLARAAIARFVEAGHLAFSVHPIHVDSFAEHYGEFRRIEPNRPAIVVIEDVDMLVDRPEEADLLALLDGVGASCDGLFVLATTNHLDRLPDRIRRRPSRFDRVEEVLPPGADGRMAFLDAPGVSPEDRRAIAGATDGLPYAAIKEVLIAVSVFGESVEVAVARVRGMCGDPAGGPAR